MQNDLTFSLVFEGQEVAVHYHPRYFTGYDHFEFKSPYEPSRPIPVSQTGYRSHFAPNHEVEAAPSVESYAHEIMMSLLESTQPVDPNQLKLF